jgi:hypothetical protein
MLIAISKSRRSRRNSVRYPVNAAQPVVNRYQGKVSRIYFRADAAFAMPEVYEFLEAERIKYAIRLPANQVLQGRIGYLLKRPVGRPPNEVRRFHANFSYQAGSWTKPRRVIAKVEWHPGELYPRVGFIVTNMSRPAERVVASVGRAKSGSRKVKARSSGRGCRAGRSPPTRCGFSFTRSPTTSAAVCTSLGLVGRPEECQYPRQIGSHPGNPGLFPTRVCGDSDS